MRGSEIHESTEGIIASLRLLCGRMLAYLGIAKEAPYAEQRVAGSVPGCEVYGMGKMNIGTQPQTA